MQKKIIFIILLFVTIAFTYINVALAGSEVLDYVKPEDLRADTSSGKANNILGMVVRGIQYTGSGIALVVIMIYGVKYMLASPQEKADVKKQIIPIIIGCILLFGTVNLVSIVSDLTTDMFK